MSACTFPLVVHRISSHDLSGQAWLEKLYECIDIDCDADPTGHGSQLPCRWSSSWAHGRAYNGESFPKRKCPGCYHIKRQGQPEAVHQVG